MNSAMDAAVFALKEKIKQDIPKLDVIDEWPRPDQQLNLPSFSIISMGRQEIAPRIPVNYKNEDIENENLKVKAYYTLGEYNINLQGDLWTEYKKQRSYYYELIQDVLDGDIHDGTGLNLVMKNYYNQIAQFYLTDYAFDDSSEMATKGEWRTRFTIMLNFERIKLATENKIVETTIREVIEV